MNTTGFIRGYMAKNQEGEKYLHHVMKVMERQLQEWDETYEVKMIKKESYAISVQNSEQTSIILISNSQLAQLQSKSPYALDKYMWTKLKENGLVIKERTGNYLNYVFM
ncbi:hypothetical protein ACFFIS_06855 [Virgibacillus soli]|uniref:Uncharacterized protein n=1 Tax=Paracerasibacillus soli TaxID=480284 RepID=A0ABU5CMS8_9BACI|nr:hypothetical protein [Virgibacillus soli]MDY0407676.1 hypothetical protein [Virgibacillus soli]